MIEAYAKTLTLIVLGFAYQMGPVLRLFMASDRGPQAKKDFIKAGTPVIAAARLKAHAAAMEFSIKDAKRAGITLTDWVLPEPAEYRPEALASVVDFVEAADPATATQAMAKALEKHVRAGAREFVENLADPAPSDDGEIFLGDDEADFSTDILLSDDEKQASRDIVDAKLNETPEERRARYAANWAAEQQKRKERRLARRRGELPEPGETIPRRRFKFARVLTGDDNCAFCVMLASRGPVYSSKKRAEGLDEIIPINAKYRGQPTKIRAKALDRIEKIGNSYHTGCDCVVVPVFLDADFLASGVTDQLQAIWEKAQELEAKTEQGDHPLNLLRNYLDANPHLVLPKFDQSSVSLAA